MDEIIHSIFANQWLVIGIIGLLLLISAEAGFRLGMGLFVKKDEARKSQLGGIQGAVLGLLALLLGFTFAMAVGRYDTRRELVLEESNAIGTAYLRTSFLESGLQKTAKELFKVYVDQRLAFQDAGRTESGMRSLEEACGDTQQKLWAIAVQATEQNPSPITLSFATSMNDLIDIDATRLNASRAHVPGAVWLLLLAVAGFGCYASGYSSGSSGARSVFPNILLPLLIAVVITLIADIDRTRGGLIGISLQPLTELKASIETSE